MEFDTVPQSVCFPFPNSSFPSNIFIRGPKYSQSLSWFVRKTTKSHQGTAKKVCITCTWQLLFIAILLKSCFSCWFISLSSETCLTNSISFFLLNWHCELSRVRILHSRSQHFDRQTPWLPPSQMTSFVYFCHVQSKSAWIFVFGGEWAGLRSRAALLGPWWAPCAQSRCFRRVFQK